MYITGGELNSEVCKKEHLLELAHDEQKKLVPKSSLKVNNTEILVG